MFHSIPANKFRSKLLYWSVRKRLAWMVEGGEISWSFLSKVVLFYAEQPHESFEIFLAE